MSTQTFTVQVTPTQSGEFVANVAHYPGALDTVAERINAGSEEGLTFSEGRADTEDAAVAAAMRANLKARILAGVKGTDPTGTPMRADQVREGMKVKPPEGASFHEIKRISASRNDGQITLSAGWGSVDLLPDDVVYVLED